MFIYFYSYFYGGKGKERNILLQFRKVVISKKYICSSSDRTDPKFLLQIWLDFSFCRPKKVKFSGTQTGVGGKS